MRKISILLATYQGCDYINEQVQSLLMAGKKINGVEFEILISDDGSSDATLDVVYSLSSELIKVINKKEQGGVKNNFFKLISSVDADYVFFCDQDDFWLPNKIDLYLQEFSKSSNDMPLLIHSDLVVADENLFPTACSMFDFQALRKNASFSQLLVQNSITGCVMAMNRAAVDLLKSSQVKDSIMHDWYAALIVSAFGEIKFIDKSTILYRQHSKNQVGAKKMGLAVVFDKLKAFKKTLHDAQVSIAKTKKQAVLFRNDFESKLPADKLKQLSDYIDSFDRSWCFRLYLFLFKDISKSGFYRNFVFFFLYVFFGRKHSVKI